MRPLRGPATPEPRLSRYDYRPQAPRRPAVDPAPSRWSYRAQRLWLTPLFRAVLRVGLPAFLVVFFGGSYLADPANRTAIVEAAQSVQREVENRPEFLVNLMDVRGAGAVVTEDIRATLALEFPLSSFDLDLDALRARVEALPAVARADLRIRTGGHLVIAVVERVPAYVWQTRDGPVVLDAEGHFVASLDQRPHAAGLPNIAGEGADQHVAEAAALFRAADPLGAQVLGLARIGERRWDVVLRDDRRILLPAEGAEQALDRVLALHDVTDLFERDVLRVDLRNPDRLTVQLSPEALIEHHRLREIEARTRRGEQAG